MFLYVVFRKKINKEFVWHKHLHFYPSTYSILLYYMYSYVRGDYISILISTVYTLSKENEIIHEIFRVVSRFPRAGYSLR